MYFWLHWVFVTMCGLSLVAASGDYSLLQCVGLLRCLFYCKEQALGTWALVVAAPTLSSCGTRA